MTRVRQRQRLDRHVRSRRTRAERRHRERKGEAERLLVIVGDESRKLDDIGGQRRRYDEFVDRLQPLARNARFRDDVDDDAHECTARETYTHDTAAGNRQTVGDPVIERLRDRDGKRNARDAHRCNDATQSRARTLVPSCQVRPSRSFMTHRLPSSSIVWPSTIKG